MLTVKYISPKVSECQPKEVKVKASGHRTRAFINAMKRDLILKMNERVLKQKLTNKSL